METRYPDLKTRVQSTFIDGLFMIALMFAAAKIFDTGDDDEGTAGWVKAVVFGGIWIIYEPVATTLGSTLGNYLMNIRVRKNGDTGLRLNIGQALVRFILKFFLGWVSFLTIHSNKEKRAIHDLAAGSIVIEK
jgi:uncharacterized RDD family membrane protein YckC